jgi:hypothetical protein
MGHAGTADDPYPALQGLNTSLPVQDFRGGHRGNLVAALLFVAKAQPPRSASQWATS